MLKGLLRYTFFATMMVATLFARAHESKEAIQRVMLLDSDTLTTIDPVAITAVKHDQKLSQSAITSTVISREDIEERGINGIKDIVTYAPNFFMPDYGSRMTSSIYVRGLGTRIEQPVVGMTVDNVPVSDKNLYDTTLPDIERIEVLRGAQSTLYGRNTMLGVVNIYTLSPLRYQGVRVRADYSSKNSFNIGASAYNKFSNNIGVSIAAAASHSDGFFRNSYDNSLIDKENNFNFRTKFQYRKDFLSIDNTLALTILKQGGYPYAYNGAVNPQTESNESLKGTICYNDPSSYNRIGVTEGLTARHDWEKITLTSITAYQYLDDKMVMDQDFLPQSYFTLTQAKQQHDISEDIVIRSRSTSKYQWLAGAFAFYKHQTMQAPVEFLKDGIENLILKNINQYSGYPGEYRWGKADGSLADNLLLSSDFTTATAGWALYHESSFKSGSWSVTAGLRLDAEYISMRYHNYTASYYTAFPNNTNKAPEEVELYINDKNRLKKSLIELLPKLSVTYSINSNNNLYLSIAKGYKSGGFNTQMFSEVLQRRIKDYMGMYQDLDVDDIISYDPEKSWNFEIGGHFSTSNRRFTADAALFWIECFDQQLTVFPKGQTTGRMMTNAGRSRSFGAEVSFNAFLTKNLLLSGAYGYTNARFREFIDGENNYAGNAVPYSPENTLSARLSYTFDINSSWLSHITLCADTTAAGRIFWNESNSVSQSFYQIVNGSIRFEGEMFSVDFWAKNITNTKYDVFYFESMGNRFLQPGRGATAGVRLNLNF